MIPATATLRNFPAGERVRRILQAALDAVEPGAAVRRALRREGDTLLAGERAWDLRAIRRVYLVAAGKASIPMAQAAAALLGERLYAGAVITRRGQALPDVLPEPLRLFEASHPVPAADGVRATRQVQALLSGTQPDDLVLALISGGGSALMTVPAPGITLDDLQALTRALLASGADIRAINTLRKHLDEVKGGGLARWAAPAPVLTLVLSDVVGSPLDVIASGPTVPDESTFADALDIARRYDLALPEAVRRRLERGLRGEIPETPKAGDALFAQAYTLVVADNPLAAQAAREQAAREGFRTLLLTTSLQGEARQAGRFLAAIVREVRSSGNPLSPPACLIAGGETTVTLRGAGLGGRNQEAALGAVRDLHGLPDVLLVTLATDGSDGPTDAAGAMADGATLQRAAALGLSPDDFLRRNDSYHFFAALDDLLKTGPTQTNVNDLAFLFAL